MAEMSAQEFGVKDKDKDKDKDHDAEYDMNPNLSSFTVSYVHASFVFCKGILQARDLLSVLACRTSPQNT